MSRHRSYRADTGPPPAPGQGAEAALLDWGLGEAAVAALKAGGVI